MAVILTKWDVTCNHHGEVRETMHIVVVALGDGEKNAFGSPLLQSDIRQVKPAILYANRVTLISSGYALNDSLAQVFGSASTSPEKFVDLLEKLYSPAAQIEQAFGGQSSIQHILRLRTKCRMAQTSRKRERMRDELRVKIEPFANMDAFDREGLVELKGAQQSGALLIEGIPGLEEKGGLGAIAKELVDSITIALGNRGSSPPRIASELIGLASGTMRRLVEVIQDPDCYPLLDSAARGMIDPQTASEVTASGRLRTSHAGLAGHVMGHLPLLDAPIAELVEIRDHVSSHLSQFHHAMEELGAMLRSAQWEPDFDAEARHLYLTRVEPKVADLEQKLRDFDGNRWVRFMARAGSGLPTGVAATGIALAAAPDLIETWFDSVLAALSSNAVPVGVGAMAISWLTQYLNDTRPQRSALTGNEFYYFREVRQRLESR